MRQSLSQWRWGRSDFSHYKTMVPIIHLKQDRREERREKRETDIFWCKAYQKGQCGEGSPHMALVKADKPLVPVLHICAGCWSQDRKRLDHGENECPAEK